MKKFVWALLATCALISAGCTETEQGAVGGALAGGAVGGIIGHQSGHTGEGAAIGAAGGAIIGGLIGHSEEEKKSQPAHRVQVCPQGHEVDVTGYSSGSLVRCPIDNSTFTVE
ncbi:MAG: glycine zipper 2TM domain-containing protein [Chlamydiae bacterium]|nr:glycine zipper 2TM domain-containing protein [Chlamydiota bacterium]MBI3276712.1 glycine zipper 2TM domain-containing protein [Chlamydiota bacterium]